MGIQYKIGTWYLDESLKQVVLGMTKTKLPFPLILGVSGQVDTFGFDPKEEGPLPSPPANYTKNWQ